MAEALVIYHGNCFDGFTAAWAARNFLPSAKFHAGVYGEAPPDVTDKNVFIVDFSYKRDVLEEMSYKARSLIVIDHHKTAEADLDGFGRKMNNLDVIEYWGVIESGYAMPYQIFDMEKSGAMLAWEFFNPNKEAPELVRYVQDRDLWKFEMERSREVHAYLASFPFNFDMWDIIAEQFTTHGGRMKAAEEGGAVLRKHDLDVEKIIINGTRIMTIGGYAVQVVNAPYFMASDVGGTLAGSGHFGATYIDMPNGRVFSLRSRGADAIDVSEIAKRYGGGGHKNAAGFTMPHGWEGD